jgi:hypothetical protein
MSEEIVVKAEGGKFTTVDTNGQINTYDLNNPDKEMLARLCDVASRRVDTSPAVLQMIYIDNDDAVPPQAEPIKDVFRALIDGRITQEEAKAEILKLKALLSG